jgi:hypothetical protein
VILIGLHGPAGSGKSTIARHLVERRGFVPVSLADYFKIPSVVHDGLSLVQVFGPVEKTAETRRFLQERGTERGRMVWGEDVWCKHLGAHLYKLARMGVQRVVVDDVRFENEVKYLHGFQLPGYLDVVDAEVWAIRGRVGTGQATASEMPVPARFMDFEIQNAPGRETSALAEALSRASQMRNVGAYT